MNNYSVWLVLSWSILIAALTLLPGSTIERLNLWGILSFDKIGHSFLYGVYTILLINAFSTRLKKPYLSTRLLITSLLIAACFGGILEIAQSRIPGRNFDFLDMIANIAGSTFGLITIIIFTKIKLYS